MASYQLAETGAREAVGSRTNPAAITESTLTVQVWPFVSVKPVDLEV